LVLPTSRGLNRPSHPRNEILLLLEQRDYSVATQAQLMTAKKLIE
jgi:hypothetical protein